MEATESPLDVLSRAATMVQDSSPPDYECARRPCAGAKELPSSRWRRERRDKVGGGFSKLRSAPAPPPADTPLDMTTPRGLPPSYSQSTCRPTKPATVGGGVGGGGSRESVITAAPRGGGGKEAEGARRGGGGQPSDPVIDEHFRRSLGNDYNHLFEDTAGRAGTRVTVTGLSVDDHFAKALGDTWTKLQKAEPELPPPAQATPPPAAGAEATPPAGSKLLLPRRGLVTI